MTSTIARSEVTEWYPAHIKPIHVGYYHTRADEFSREESMYCWWWDGEFWRHHKGDQACHWQMRPWRGLRSPA